MCTCKLEFKLTELDMREKMNSTWILERFYVDRRE